MSGRSRSGSRRSVSARAAVVAAVLLGTGLAAAAPASAQGFASITVGAAGPACPAPTHATLADAVAAAAPGSTIAVCAGIFTGTVVVDKPLVFLGAQRGVDARTARADAAAESVIDGGVADGFRIVGTTSGVTIDGFTVRTAGPASGVDASGGVSGLTVVNNVITGAVSGVRVSTDGTAPSTVGRNRFLAEGPGLTGIFGVAVCCGPGDDLAITDNLFVGHVGAAVDTDGGGVRPSTGLRIERNRSVDDATFAVVHNATGASVTGNVVLRSAQAPEPGSAIVVGSGTADVLVVRNLIDGGTADGIEVSGGPGAGVTVSGNRISDRRNGIRLAGQSAGSVGGNTVDGSAEVGILLDAETSGITVSDNRVSRSGISDCRDASTGTATAGTANTWVGNTGPLAPGPAGICS